jgi:hypothetical protein
MDTQAVPGFGAHEERAESNGRAKASFVGYYLDESDPDILILRRRDDSFVAAFSAQGATREGIREAAEEDFYRASRNKPSPWSLDGDAQSGEAPVSSSGSP